MKRGMKSVFAAVFGVLLAASLSAQELTAYEIIKRSDEVPTADTSSYKATMTLTNKKGQKRVREVLMRSKDFGDVKKTVIVFTTPKDVAGVGYLMFEYDKKPDGTTPESDNWLYMPAMKKVRRISGAGKADDFMGTDFTYEDMGDRDIDKDSYTLLRRESIEGNECWKIECLAKDTTEKNPRRVVWIRKDNYLLQQGEFYDRQNNLQRTLTCSGIHLQDGFWTTDTMLMKNVLTNHSTVLEMKDVKYNLAIDDKLLTVSALERGIVR